MQVLVNSLTNAHYTILFDCVLACSYTNYGHHTNISSDNNGRPDPLQNLRASFLFELFAVISKSALQLVELLVNSPTNAHHTILFDCVKADFNVFFTSE